MVRHSTLATVLMVRFHLALLLMADKKKKVTLLKNELIVSGAK